VVVVEVVVGVVVEVVVGVGVVVAVVVGGGKEINVSSLAAKNTIHPYGYSGTRAYLQAQEIARDGVPALVQALERTIADLQDLQESYDALQDVVQMQDDLNAEKEEREKLEKERDDLQARLDNLASEDNRVKDAEVARKEATDARSDADHWREMYGRIEAERFKDAKIATEYKMKLRDLQDSVREIVGDDPGALLTAVYWRTQAHDHGVELMALRKRVAELEAPSARKMSTRQLEEDRNYWKSKAIEIVGGRST
jgi:predicted nuclease with TOPRIM domain